MVVPCNFPELTLFNNLIKSYKDVMKNLTCRNIKAACYFVENNNFPDSMELKDILKHALKAVVFNMSHTNNLSK